MKSVIIVIFAFLLTTCKNKENEKVENSSKPIVDIQQIVGIGRIEPENEIIQLSTEIGGIVQKVYKKENDTILAGDVIFELKHDVEDANIVQLKQAVALQEAQIKVDEISIEELQIRYNNSEVELLRLKKLLENGSETQQVVDNATTEMKVYIANIKKLKATVEVSKIKLKETRSQVSIAEVQLKQKFVTSPVKGVLLELNIQPGNYIDSKQVFAQLNPEGKTIAVCEIDELFANKIKLNQTTVIRNFGALDTLSTGKIYFAASFLKKKSLFTDQPGEKEDRRVREIKILLDNPSSVLLNSRIECVVNLSKTNQ